MTQETQELAYHLWLAAGQPQGDGQEFWLKAEQQLVEQAWKVECGSFVCNGFGTLNEVIKCALTSATQEGRLSSMIIATSENGEVLHFDTKTELTRHGLYKARRHSKSLLTAK